jgi:hypothetical protein
MSFTYTSWIVAILGALAGLLMLAMGASAPLIEPFSSNPTARLGMKHGANMVLASIALGTLAEISFSVGKKSPE